jgi:hypothetical protein
MVMTTSVVFADADGNQPPFGKGGFQPPFGRGQFGKDRKTPDKKDDKKTEEKKDDKRADDKRAGDKKGPTPKSDATVDAWLKVLLEKITDPHDTVRDSARGAIVAVGSPAIPALQKLADGGDPAKAVAARKLITAIQGRPTSQGRERPGMGPMAPGMRPDFFGGQRGRGFGPGDRGRGFGPGDRRRGPGRDEESELDVAPMPREVVSR